MLLARSAVALIAATAATAVLPILMGLLGLAGSSESTSRSAGGNFEAEEGDLSMGVVVASAIDQQTILDRGEQQRGAPAFNLNQRNDCVSCKSAPELQTVKTLRFNEFLQRVTDISCAVDFSVSAIDNHRVRLLPKQDETREVFRIKLGENALFSAANEQVKSKLAGILDSVLDRLCPDKPSKALLLNLTVVMLCTELEVFITHLVDALLANDPRQLLSIASEKNLSTAEILEAKDYEGVLSKVRERIANEITNSNTERMFLHHLGKRFRLLSEAELIPAEVLKPKPPVDLMMLNLHGWNMQELDTVFKIRHDIVHRGLLPIQDAAYIMRVASYFGYLELLLSRNARLVYTIPMNLNDWLVLFAMCSAYGLEYAALTDNENIVTDDPNDPLTALLRS
jgi:hypothetical protein